MQLFFLYVFTVVLFVASMFLVQHIISVSSGGKAKMNEEEVRAYNWTNFFIYLLIYNLAILSYAVIPSLGKGGLSQAMLSGLILSSAAHVGSFLGNFQYSRIRGIKTCTISVMEAVASTSITTPVVYGVAVWMLGK